LETPLIARDPEFLDQFITLSKEDELFVVTLKSPNLPTDALVLTASTEKFRAECVAIIARFIVREAYLLAQERASKIADQMGQAAVGKVIAEVLRQEYTSKAAA